MTLVGAYLEWISKLPGEHVVTRAVLLSAVLLSLISSVWVWIGPVLGGIISTIVRAIRRIDAIQEVVKGCTFDEISNLVENGLLWVDKSHAILQVKIRLSIETKGHVRLLDNAAINRLQDWPGTDLLSAEVPEEHV